MTRMRSIALSITLTLLATGCYTQLRAPHAKKHYRSSLTPSYRYGHKHWHRPRPVYHLPRYDHHDWWLYGDAHCDVWVDRYYDYHPWFPRFDTLIHIGRPHRPHHPGHRRGRHVWNHSPIKHKPRWRHYGPRFAPLSPTIDVEIQIVDRRNRFRRSGFAGDVPGRPDPLVATMSTSGSSEGANVNRTVRVTRPRKIAKALVHQAVFSPQGADLSTASPDYKREGKWEIWNKSSKPRSASPEKDRRRDDRWSDPGRDTKEWGPVSSVKERPARQPKPQTNWFNPKDTGDEPESGSRKGRRGDRAGISDPVTTTTGPVEKPKDRWRSREVKPSTSTWEKRDKADKRAQKQERNWSPSPQVERRPDPKPKRTWTPPPKADTQPEKQERSWSPSPKVERRPAPPKRTWSPPPKVERREEPRKTYSPPPKREEPKREVKRSSSSSSRKKPSKNEPKKEEKKSTKNDDKKDREEKRKRSGRRRGK